MTGPALVRALRRGAIPLILGIACWIASIPAIEDLDPLLKWVGTILLVLGLVITLASARTYSAEERRIGARSLAGRPANLPPDGRT